MYAVYSLAKLLAASDRKEESESLFKTLMYHLPEFSKVYYELGNLAAGKGKAGISNYYLGKYNLYEGKLKLAVFSLKAAGRDKKLPEAMKKEAKVLLAKIERLRKK